MNDFRDCPWTEEQWKMFMQAWGFTDKEEMFDELAKRECLFLAGITVSKWGHPRSRF